MNPLPPTPDIYLEAVDAFLVLMALIIAGDLLIILIILWLRRKQSR